MYTNETVFNEYLAKCLPSLLFI